MSSLEGRSISPTSSQPALTAAQEALSSLRLSMEMPSRTSTPNGVKSPNGVNGKTFESSRSSGEYSTGVDKVEQLQRDLERTREEKESLAAQYRNLVAKLNTMRTTLGNKLQQDAEELDRREQTIQQLTAQNEDLSATVQTLRDEILTSNEEAEHASRELEAMRSRAYEDNTQEALVRERELREAHTELERCRIERDELEQHAMQDSILLDEIRSTCDALKREVEMEREARLREARELDSERERSFNLQSVLQDFQNSKDRETREALADKEKQLSQITQSLAEYKHRAHTAEMLLEESSASTSRAQDLEKEVKEKNLLIGKLRHEAVIMNEHLIEALRRLRRNSQEFNVDRRLVTNILLQFLTTDRADSKRFEMLNVLATILSWNDVEREKAGLQRSQGTPSSIRGRSTLSSPAKGKASEKDKGDDNESFSQMWVEFLLKEATSGSRTDVSSLPSPTRSNPSLPSSPTLKSSKGLRPSRPSLTELAVTSSSDLGSPGLQKA